MHWIPRCAKIRRARIELALALALAVACAESPSPRCKQLCEREAECVERHGDEQAKYDKTECATECSALERDRDGKASVDRHMACAAKATTCAELMACR